MIAPGAIVVCRQTGAVAWIVERQEADGRWRVASKEIDDKGREVFNSRTAGQGDLVLIAPAPVFEPGAEIEHDGMQYTVIRDCGDSVELLVPPRRFPLKGGEHLHIPAGNAASIPKSDLVLEDLR